MKASPLPRKAARISDSLHRQLNMYALAAGAARVGALVSASPAEAKVVYTAADVKIVLNAGLIKFGKHGDRRNIHLIIASRKPANVPSVAKFPPQVFRYLGF